MIIILEGADGAGKTTFANRLHDRLPFARRMTSGPFDGDPFHEYETRLEVWDGYTPIICDRWHLGEMIYGPMYRGGSKIDDVSRWHIEAFLAARGATQVGLLTPPHVAAERLECRGDDLVDPTRVGEITEAYIDLLPRTTVMTSSIQCETLNDPNSTCDHLERVLQDAATTWCSAAILRPFKTYVGTINTRYLILGERRNDDRYSAAFVPTGSSSGRYMLEHLLPALGMLRNDVGIANACEEDVVALWHALGQPQVVALGNESYRAARRSIDSYGGYADFPLGAVPHPQYVRRFHHKFGAQYARTIISALETSEDLRTWRPT